ncbi:MAG: 30S ribosomal protein S8 [bacterium]|nr:30S ribosomal protein S8 [bacterium]
MNNKVSDMLIRIKNASMARHQSLELPYSTLAEDLAKLLLKNNYLERVKVEGKGVDQRIKIELKYKGKKSAITDLRQLSKPGLRRYLKAKEIVSLRRSGPGIVVLSTPQGLLTNFEARAKNTGGEILFEIW